jgi:FSR family fosmidomycin resistance protein-like MFS transporter
MGKTPFRKNLILVSLGHFTIDAYASFFPIYIAMRDLNLLKAGAVSTISSLISNFIQPFFGLLADKIDKRWLWIIALLLGPLAMSVIGLTQSYLLLTVLVTLGKLLISLFHPASVDVASQAEGGGRSQLGLSIFITAGTLGLSFSTIIFYQFCVPFGFERSYLLAVPAVVLAAYFFFAGPEQKRVKRSHVVKGFFQILGRNLPYVTVLFFLVVIRAVLQFALTYALPTLYKEWGFDEALWTVSHFLFIGIGAFSMLFFGLIEKRIDTLKLLKYSMLATVPLCMGFLYSGASGSAFSLVWVSLLGFALFSSFPANVVLGQKRMPEFAGTISGILMGAAWGVASFTPLLVSVLGGLEVPGKEHGTLFPGTFVAGVLPVIGY